MAQQETLKYGLVLHKTQEGLQISGRTYEVREYLKSKGGKWNPQAKAWLFSAETDFSDLKMPPPPPPKPYEPNMWVFDRLRDKRRRECCSQCKREFDEFDPQGPMWYVCPTHGKWKSDYSGT